MKIVLIRHGQTDGNKHGRYIGCKTDEPLSESGVLELSRKTYPDVCAVFTSPMQRCTQTARIIYKDIPYECIEDLKECDFGEFEGLGYADLNGKPEYQTWIDSGGTLPFPGGESKSVFSERCIRAFESILQRRPGHAVAIIAHGGTIMSIMEHYAVPHGSYYDFRVPNGCGYVLNEDGSYTSISNGT